ncbi:hypothetical protein [Microbacterium allomyrinae]|uniref:DUF4430 domain-containing protein n=1 Tax=Microbacterium allomyrinae TaxID=2830666 RepID=A0A9X1LSM6_9MICO|nr:hypothetical protein [Microbacterium allomyrinae]MCC2031309.1 hypothetical protein [Microbacterium allomyrinae]
MTSTLRTLTLAAASAALLLSLAACSTATPETAASTPAASDEAVASVIEGACVDDAGVTVVVDSAALEGGSAQEWCVPTDTAIGAADALAAADVETEGTDQYGDQVVCRVNGVPAEDLAIAAEDGSEYFEECATMSPEFAYWSLWVQPAGGEWGFAQEGLSTLQLEPGDGVELLFTLHGEPAAPVS